MVDGFFLDQISYAAPSTGNVPCSEYGRAGFAVRATPGVIQYAQVTAQLAGGSPTAAWIVQNVPLLATFNEEQSGVNLTLLGVKRGTCFSGAKLSYTITITDNVITAAPTYSGGSVVFVGQVTNNDDGIDITGLAGSPGLPPPATATQQFAAVQQAVFPPGLFLPPTSRPPGDLNALKVNHAGSPNITQNKNECAPGGVVNSMYWLQNMGWVNLGNDTQQQSLDKLKSDMSWNVNSGVTPQNIIKGKLMFAQRPEHPLSLDIHYQSSDAIYTAAGKTGFGSSVTAGSKTANRDGADAPPSIEDIRLEMDLGQDVELVVMWTLVDLNTGKIVPAGAHLITVTGVAGNQGFFFSDDAGQDGTGSNKRNNMWVPAAKEHNDTTNQDYLTLGGLGQQRGSEVVAVISESPIPGTYAVAPLENAADINVFYNGFPLLQTGKQNPLAIPQFAPAPSSGFTQVAGAPFPAGSQAVAAASALQKFVYVTNYGSNTVSGFNINPTTGALTAITGSPFPAGANPFSIAIDSKGLYAYVGNYGGASISAYSIDPTTGALTAIPGSPFSTGASPASVAVSPSGRLLYAAGSGGVSVYSIDPLPGVLTGVSGSPFAAGNTPYWVTPDPSGQFVYVANAGFAGTSSVSGFTVGQTGALTPITGSPFTAGTTPQAMAIDPRGHFLYVANYASNNVSAFSVNSTTGALTKLAGSPYTVDPGPFGIAADPSGQYVYVASQANTNGSIAVFSTDITTGALTPAQGSPFPAGAGPARLAIVPIIPNAGITNPAPAIAQVAPSAAATGAASAAVTVWGKNFVPGAVVRWNGSARNTELISSTELIFGASAADLASASNATLTVTNPAPGGGNSTSTAFNVAASISIPSVPGDATVNDAGFTAGTGVSPGSIAASFGTGLSNATVMFNGSIPAYVFFSSSGQMNLQIPWEVFGPRHAFATFTNASGISAPSTVVISPAAPGVFTLNPAGIGAIANNTTGVVTAAVGAIAGLNSQPAQVGDYIAIYATGLGPVTNQPGSGQVAPSDPNHLSFTAATPTITIGGVGATQFFSGLAPGFVGLYQIVVQVPTGVTAGNAVPVVVNIAGQTSNSVTIAVQ